MVREVLNGLTVVDLCLTGLYRQDQRRIVYWCYRYNHRIMWDVVGTLQPPYTYYHLQITNTTGELWKRNMDL